MRLFLGIELPEPLVAEFGRVQSLLRASAADVRWVATVNAHLTLKFLGEVEADRVTAIDAALEPVMASHPPHELELVGVGVFPDEARPRVIWVGVEGAIRKLAALHAKVDASLGPLGFEPESRRFSPHLTLGRVRRPRGLAPLAETVRRLRHEVVGSMLVKGVTLFDSTLTPRGAHYTTVSHYPLGR